MPKQRLGILLVRFFAIALILFSLVVTVRVRAQEEKEKSPHSTWSTYLGNADSSHYSSLTQINLSNVDKLQVAWKYEEGVDRAYEFSPIVVGSTMYVMARKTSVVALDAATGKELWIYHSKYAPAWEMHRGINFWQSKDGSDQRLFIPIASHLEAINAKTGELITSFGTDGRVDLMQGLGRDFKTISQIQSATPGVVYGDLLILGSSTGEEYGSPPGDIRAYDVRTGKMVWIFHTVPHPGEPGYDTWPKDTWKYEGGTNCWGEMSLDAERGIVYVPTGAPTYDFYGADRIGNDLYCRHTTCARRSHWKINLVLPDGPSRFVGLRSHCCAPIADSSPRWTGSSDRRAGHKAWIPLRIQSRDRQTVVADRGTSGPEV